MTKTKKATKAPAAKIKATVTKTPSGRVSRSKASLTQQLFLAVQSPDARSSKILGLLYDKADPNAIDEAGLTPLHYAVKHANSYAVSLMLRYKANDQALTPEGETPLSLAVDMALKERVSHWYSQGTIVKTPVSYTIKDGVMTFVKNGAKKPIARKDESLIASRFCPQHHKFMTMIDICELFLNRKQKLDLKNSEGVTIAQRLADLKSPLIDAIAKRKGHTLPAPRRAAPDPQKLRDAAYQRDINALKEQLELGADPNAQDEQGRVALIVAAQEAFAQGVKALLDAGADPNKTTSGGFNSLHLVIAHTKNRPLNFKVTLTRKGKQVTLTDPDEIRAAIGSHPDDEYQDCVAVAKLLIGKGINVDQKTDEHKQTPLSHAASYGTAEIASLLLKTKKVELNSQDKDGLTPLHFASRNGHVDAVNVLLKAGADPNVTESYGFTPLHEAAENNHIEVAKALLKAGAKPELGLTRSYKPYEKGATPRDIALSKSYKEIAVLLEPKKATTKKK